MKKSEENLLLEVMPSFSLKILTKEESFSYKDFLPIYELLLS